jgi:hypothetical protein
MKEGEGDIHRGGGGMAKYGRGVNREIVGAVNQGIIDEPFSVADIRHFAQKCGWNIPENYLIDSLANASSQDHSLTYKKYFQSLGNGQYQLVGKYRGFEWR